MRCHGLVAVLVLNDIFTSRPDGARLRSAPPLPLRSPPATVSLATSSRSDPLPSRRPAQFDAATTTSTGAGDSSGKPLPPDASQRHRASLPDSASSPRGSFPTLAAPLRPSLH
ncbi:hypothetical protein ABZP36_008691 [Zizania latifolia]